MAWLLRSPVLPAGILPSRRQAQPALLRMFGRARRRNEGLLLARLAPQGEPATAAEVAQQRFLATLPGEVRLTDLTWSEPGGPLMLLEAATRDTELRQRLERHAAFFHLHLDWRAARFPEQGLTLEALLDQVQWPR